MTAARRILALDIARTVALAGMATYHFTYDLTQFGYLRPGLATEGGWAIFARVVAGSFLFLAGASLTLAHGEQIRWRAFLRRAAMIAAGALIVSIATYQLAPDDYVFFGILHAILTASVIGLAFLRVPALATLAVAAAILALKPYLQAPVFDLPPLLWLGLSTEGVQSMDYVPVFPWVAPFLAGLAVAKMLKASGWLEALARAIPSTAATRALAWPGRHSLAIYLIHQPVLIGLLVAATLAIRQI